MKSKVIVLFLAALILSSATTAYAVNEHSNSRASENYGHSKTNENVLGAVQNSQVEDSEENEDGCGEDVRNHGEYVSCVAKTHPGGDAVSEAAHSDVGKKFDDEDEEEDETPTISPSVTPVASPSVSPEVSPTISPEVSPEITPEASPSATPESQPIGEQINGFIDQIKELLNKISSLLS